MSDQPLALVLLDRAVEPDLSAVVKALRVRHQGLQAEVVADPRDAKANARSHLLRCGDDMVAVMMMPVPIPQDPGLWTRAATTWPEARAVAARHQAHVIVSSLGESKHRLSDARAATAVVGALISTTPGCCAVVWGSDVARSAKTWLEMSKQSFAPYPDYPFTLWFDVLPFRSGAMIGAVTKGVAAFAGREIEFETDKLGLADVMNTVVGLAAYLVEQGPVLKDGDTFGEDERERFQVRFRNSDRFPNLRVFFCHMPSAS